MLPNPPEMEKLDPRVKRTRQLLLDSFQSLLADKNFEAISVQDVAEKAQVNRATFYAHFTDKYALLDYFITHKLMQEISARTLDACHYTPENLRTLVVTVCEFLGTFHGGNCAQPHAQFEALIEGQIKKQVFDLLVVWLKQTKTKVAIELPATVATWAIYGLASHYSHIKKRPSLEKFLDEALPLVAVNLEQFA
jgi:AcrR family transcriptional regulator